jgi:hypothetical protein
MKVLRFAALVGILVTSWLVPVKTSHAIESCGTKAGSACTQSGARGYCYKQDDICWYTYPCWCERNSLGTLTWRCGTTPIQESCDV